MSERLPAITVALEYEKNGAVDIARDLRPGNYIGLVIVEGANFGARAVATKLSDVSARDMLNDLETGATVGVTGEKPFL